MNKDTVEFLSRPRTRRGRRVPSCFEQAVPVIPWFLDGTRVAQLACATPWRKPSKPA